MASEHPTITSQRSQGSDLDSNAANTGGSLSPDLNSVADQMRVNARAQRQSEALRFKQDQTRADKDQERRHRGAIFYSGLALCAVLAIASFIVIFVLPDVFPDLVSWAQNILTTMVGAFLGFVGAVYWGKK